MLYFIKVFGFYNYNKSTKNWIHVKWEEGDDTNLYRTAGASLKVVKLIECI